MDVRQCELRRRFSDWRGPSNRPSKPLMKPRRNAISIVTPSLGRPVQVRELLENVSRQTLLPMELILVDGASPELRDTENVISEARPNLPFPCVYKRHARGTAIQRNAGIDVAHGAFIAFIDDDVRLEPDFLER